jgi:hypothetical protein
MKKYFEYIIIIFTVIVIFSLGVMAGRFFFPKTITKIIPKEKEKIVYVKGDIATNTIIKYVPKEISSQTGQQENTDIELNTNKQNVNVLVNGKSFEFKPLNNETYNFENGKILFNQETSLKLDINLPKPERKIELGGYLSTDSFGGTIIIPKRDNGSYILMGGPNYDFKGWEAIFSITFPK